MTPPARSARVARVAVEVEPAHLDRPFDYLVPDDLHHEVGVGSRVEVVFAGRRRRALVTDLATATEVPPDRLRPLRRVFGPHAWMTPDELAVARWAAQRYAAPLGMVLRHALPARVVDVERRAEVAGWFPPGAGHVPTSDPAPDPAAMTRNWAGYGTGGQRLRSAAASGDGAFFWRPLPDEDVGARLAELVQLTVAAGRDVVVVAPDPASPTADAIVAAAGDLAMDVRGGRSARRAYRAWLAARCRHARVVVGERGVAFWPVGALGLAVVLDEANPAHKERRTPRHHTREVLLERARRSRATAVLVGLVPSAAAWRLLGERRLAPVVGERAVERRAAPVVRVDTQQGRVRARLGAAGLRALRAAASAGAYGVVLAARRGEGGALACGRCGELRRCPRCQASLARQPPHGLRCDICGWSHPAAGSCPVCGATPLVPLAAGTQQLATELRRSLSCPVAALEGYAAVAPPPPAVLVTTRGSVLDAPPGQVASVVLLDLDTQVRRPVLDAAEDTLRLAMQVARWTVAGSPDDEERPAPGAPGPPPGRRREGAPSAPDDRNLARVVVAQTREPDHPVVQALVRWDPGGFWRTEAAVRALLRFPPAAFAIQLDALADDVELGAELAALVPAGDEVLGPLPRDDRAVYLVKSDDRVATVAALDAPRRQWSRDGRDVRIDVDPVVT